MNPGFGVGSESGDSLGVPYFPTYTFGRAVVDKEKLKIYRRLRTLFTADPRHLVRRRGAFVYSNFTASLAETLETESRWNSAK